MGLLFSLKLFLSILYYVTVSTVIYVNETLGNLVSLLLGFFVFPIFEVNFFRKQTVESFFEFQLLDVVRDNPGDYIVTVLKQYALGIVFLILSFILVGIPALLFANSIFVANLYGRLVEQRHNLALKTQRMIP